MLKNKGKSAVIDVRPIKASLREEAKGKRIAMTPEEKRSADDKIARRLYALEEYKSCKTLLIYVSTPIEVDTRSIINRAIADGKRVAAPRCISKYRSMDFYYIDSLEKLERGCFGVLEPNPLERNRVRELSKGLCVVPALLFDPEGYRIGYGGGYYDRFLARFWGITVGICYSSCIKEKLVRGKFDRPVNILLTEDSVMRTDSRR